MAAKLKGKSLSQVIGLIGAVGFVLQGYDQAVSNGLLTLGSFIAVFPQIDTVNTSGGEKSHNSTIQGMLLEQISHKTSTENNADHDKAPRSLFMKLDAPWVQAPAPF